VIESATERPLNRYEQQRVAATTANPPEAAALTYLLATQVPDYWIPLLPVHSDTGLRLQRGAMLEIDGLQEPVEALGHLLNPAENENGLAIFEEEIPREGIRVTRNYQLARWQDGSTHLWIGRRKRVGSGEGSSGLKFDTLAP
jgi:hypothetical protein